ncbi:MAG: flagellar hook-length control protein FliK [Myxococcaceae bacterium]|nr:flagellar hook-length control protein FliK [Myxococcaceae bacterium]
MVLPPTFSVVAAKASPPSPTAEDIGTKRDELKGRAVERPAGAEALAMPLLPRPPAILELAAQRAAAPAVEPRRTKAEAPALESVMAAGTEPKRDVEKKDRDELTALGRPTTPPAPAELAPPTRLEVANAAPPVPNVTPAMLEDPSLRVVVLPTLARVNVETADQGSLALQVRVQDGVTDIRATGPAASLIESRQGELRVALANEGLALGHFDLGQSDSGGGRRERFDTPDERDFGPRRAPLRAVSGSTTRTDGRLSVKA